MRARLSSPSARSRRLTAVAFPVVMHAHLVAYLMMVMRGSLCGSDCAERSGGCGNGQDDLLHYRILKSVVEYSQCSTTHAARSASMPHRRVNARATMSQCTCPFERRTANDERRARPREGALRDAARSGTTERARRRACRLQARRCNGYPFETMTHATASSLYRAKRWKTERWKIPTNCCSRSGARTSCC